MNRVTQAMEKWRAIEAEYGLEKAKSMANTEADRQQEWLEEVVLEYELKGKWKWKKKSIITPKPLLIRLKSE